MGESDSEQQAAEDREVNSHTCLLPVGALLDSNSTNPPAAETEARKWMARRLFHFEGAAFPAFTNSSSVSVPSRFVSKLLKRGLESGHESELEREECENETTGLPPVVRFVVKIRRAVAGTHGQ
jgi:hypothetical protein